MVELLPRAESFGPKDEKQANKGAPDTKRQKLDIDGGAEQHVRKEWYQISGEWAQRVYRELGYGSKGLEIPAQSPKGL